MIINDSVWESLVPSSLGYWTVHWWKSFGACFCLNLIRMLFCFVLFFVLYPPEAMAFEWRGKGERICHITGSVREEAVVESYLVVWSYHSVESYQTLLLKRLSFFLFRNLLSFTQPQWASVKICSEASFYRKYILHHYSNIISHLTRKGKFFPENMWLLSSYLFSHHFLVYVAVSSQKQHFVHFLKISKQSFK